MKAELTHAALKAKQRAIRAGFPETMGLRVHRAISWIGRAEACGEDDDARFVFLWIAFNAAYADETEFQVVQPGERAAFVGYFSRLIALNQERRIYRAIRSEEHTSELQSLMRISYAVFCLKKKKRIRTKTQLITHSLYSYILQSHSRQ